jgi:hypothetical protein
MGKSTDPTSHEKDAIASAKPMLIVPSARTGKSLRKSIVRFSIPRDPQQPRVAREPRAGFLAFKVRIVTQFSMQITPSSLLSLRQEYFEGWVNFQREKGVRFQRELTSKKRAK